MKWVSKVFAFSGAKAPISTYTFHAGSRDNALAHIFEMLELAPESVGFQHAYRVRAGLHHELCPLLQAV